MLEAAADNSLSMSKWGEHQKNECEPQSFFWCSPHLLTSPHAATRATHCSNPPQRWCCSYVKISQKNEEYGKEDLFFKVHHLRGLGKDLKGHSIQPSVFSTRSIQFCGQIIHSQIWISDSSGWILSWWICPAMWWITRGPSFWIILRIGGWWNNLWSNHCNVSSSYQLSKWTSHEFSKICRTFLRSMVSDELEIWGVKVYAEPYCAISYSTNLKNHVG